MFLNLRLKCFEAKLLEKSTNASLALMKTESVRHCGLGNEASKYLLLSDFHPLHASSYACWIFPASLRRSPSKSGPENQKRVSWIFNIVLLLRDQGKTLYISSNTLQN